MCDRPSCRAPSIVGVMRLQSTNRWEYSGLCEEHGQEAWDRAREQGHDHQSRSLQQFPLHG